MTAWNFHFSDYVRLLNDLLLCQEMQIFFYVRGNDSAHFGVKFMFLSWEMRKLYWFEIWSLSVHYDIDARRVS